MNHSNIFLKIINGQIPASIVYDDEYLLAFNDINPSAPIHVLAIPKLPYTSFSDFMERAEKDLYTNFFCSLHKVIKHLKISENGYRLITNCGNHGGQTVDHFHIHILAGEPIGPLTFKDKAHKTL
ncbi:HIT domain-containing protein [Candidatus Cyrtobacter comes]|uniref:HIT domain-containing protein n=1 Tax=Candidatus Cyrtobacter comes TaxID=675776 RepID=A0ABU5L7A7_9RICK|nr:HIT domain-containing protein [Candidatus Cyrtobacter comes]MDZ5761694.1 HIT domain-containing protein [Candidatus Cyrtobacter comes]